MEDINIKDLEVRKEIACGDIIIKLYTPPVKQRYNRNITGENIDGEILWQLMACSLPPLGGTGAC